MPLFSIRRDNAFITRDIWAEHGGRRAYGQLYLPRSAEDGGLNGADTAENHGAAEGGTSATDSKLPAVICTPFYGGNYRTAGEWAKLMARAGFAAVAWTVCGGGRPSTGPSTSYSIKTEAEDLSCMLDVVRALPQVDESRVYLLGQSQGGMCSTMVADARPGDVAGLFLLYPALVIPDDMHKRFGSPENVPATFDQWGKLGRIYAVDAMAYDPYEHMTYPGPVRIWHGDRDTLVPLAYAQRAARTYPNATLEVVHGAGHGFYGDEQEHIANEIVACVRD